MKRFLLFLALALFATAPLAQSQSVTETSNNPWAMDHNFIAPAP